MTISLQWDVPILTFNWLRVCFWGKTCADGRSNGATSCWTK